MIKDIVSGDITSPENRADIIIGMNSKLKDVTGIGMPFVSNVKTVHPIELGSVLSFKFDGSRQLHMIVCHHLGPGGWEDADMHVRFGMDYLWHTSKRRKYSIVKIGTGRVGIRDGSDPIRIHTAMATSHLPVTLFIYDPKEKVAVVSALERPLVPYRAWHPVHGEERIAA